MDYHNPNQDTEIGNESKLDGLTVISTAVLVLLAGASFAVMMIYGPELGSPGHPIPAAAGRVIMVMVLMFALDLWGLGLALNALWAIIEDRTRQQSQPLLPWPSRRYGLPATSHMFGVELGLGILIISAVAATALWWLQL